jgi:hypothetical protein
MNTNNAYKLYCALYNKYHPGRTPMEMKDCINNLTRSLLQQSDEMRQRGYGAAPSATKDLTSTTSGDGWSIQADAKNQPFTSPTAAHGMGQVHVSTPRTPTVGGLYYQEFSFKKRKRDYNSRVHQPMPMLVRGTGEKSGSGARCDYYWIGHGPLPFRDQISLVLDGWNVGRQNQIDTQDPIHNKYSERRLTNNKWADQDNIQGCVNVSSGLEATTLQ